jgi:hypothetical protein
VASGWCPPLDCQNEAVERRTLALEKTGSARISSSVSAYLGTYQDMRLKRQSNLFHLPSASLGTYIKTNKDMLVKSVKRQSNLSDKSLHVLLKVIAVFAFCRAEQHVFGFEVCVNN